MIRALACHCRLSARILLVVDPRIATMPSAWLLAMMDSRRSPMAFCLDHRWTLFRQCRMVPKYPISQSGLVGDVVSGKSSSYSSLVCCLGERRQSSEGRGAGDVSQHDEGVQRQIKC